MGSVTSAVHRGVQAPVSAVILGGLTSSTLLNLVVIPPLFARFAAPASQRDRPQAAPKTTTITPAS